MDEISDNRVKQLQEHWKKIAKRCPTCPKDTEGYSPALTLKFTFGVDEEGCGTTVYQCPQCKEIFAL